MPAIKGARTSKQHTKISKQKALFQLILKGRKGIVPELQFSVSRKFRFDFAHVEKKVAFEYEGINSNKSRHTTITGYTRDCEKYNLAALNGWKVFRFTALNYGSVIKILEKLGIE
mgnify:CR=1 FL=1